MKISCRKRRVFLWLLLGAAVLLVGILLSKKPVPTGQLRVQVLDGKSEAPLSGCAVVVAETGLRALTDESGSTPVLTVPVCADERFSGVLPQTWGEVTLLVYREGYVPYALFHVQVSAGALREGPRIYLFLQDGTMEDQPFSVIEGPPRDWVNALLEQFSPASSPAPQS